MRSLVWSVRDGIAGSCSGGDATIVPVRPSVLLILVDGDSCTY